MRIVVLLIMSALSCKSIPAQTIDTDDGCIQGYWQGVSMTKEPFSDLGEQILIYNSTDQLYLDVEEKSVSISKYFFRENKTYVEVFSEDGEEFVNEEPLYSCDSTSLILFYSEYKRLSALSEDLIQLLDSLGSADEKNYLQEFTFQ